MFVCLCVPSWLELQKMPIRYSVEKFEILLVYTDMVNINDIGHLLKQHEKLWDVIAGTEPFNYAYGLRFCRLDDELDGYDYSDEQALYVLFGNEGHHEFIALFVPEGFDDKADECPVYFVDPETTENDEVVGSTSNMGNIKTYLTGILEHYSNVGDNEVHIVECREVLEKIKHFSNNEMLLRYQLKPFY